MASVNFKALVVEKTADKQFVRGIRERNIDDLPPGDLVITGRVVVNLLEN